MSSDKRFQKLSDIIFMIRYRRLSESQRLQKGYLICLVSFVLYLFHLWLLFLPLDRSVFALFSLPLHCYLIFVNMSVLFSLLTAEKSRGSGFIRLPLFVLSGLFSFSMVFTLFSQLMSLIFIS